MGALVSTGNETWEVKVMGNLPEKNSWGNLAIRWKKPNLESPLADPSELGGLQLFLNLNLAGQAVLPCIGDYHCTVQNIDVQEIRDNATIVVGGHRTQENPTVRGFSGGSFDEIVFWNRWIPNDEKFQFLGGWSRIRFPFLL